MNNNLYNKNNYINNNTPKNKLNILNSLQEVEYFLNNLNSIFCGVKFVKLIKKFK